MEYLAKYIGSNPLLKANQGYHIFVKDSSSSGADVEIKEYRGISFNTPIVIKYRSINSFLKDWTNVRARFNKQ